MKKGVMLAVLVAVLGGAGYWVWVTFFPNAETAVRKRLNALAEAGSFPSNESPLAKLASAQGLGNFFTTDAEILVNVPGRSQQTLSGREEVVQAALAAHSTLAGLTVNFYDIVVTVAPDKQSATANLTAKVRMPGEKDFNLQELKLELKKIEGQWLIHKVETVKTLSERKIFQTSLCIT